MPRVVLVTGAKGGLGTFVTDAFLNAGDTVVGISRSVQPADFPRQGFRACSVDLSDSQATRTAVERLARDLGPIDVLAHLAGGFAGGQPIYETEDATWNRMLALNLRVAVNVFRAVVPHMRQAGHGRIIAIAARAALEPAPGIAAYSASKAALVSLVRTLALENADRGITANAILPGTMDTPGNRAADPAADRSGWVDPAHVAALVLFLAADAAAAITGAVIPFYGTPA